jgi:hypothetical protein
VSSDNNANLGDFLKKAKQMETAAEDAKIPLNKILVPVQ